MQLLGDVAHRALEQEHALAAQRLHDVHLLILCQAVDLHGVVRHDGGDDARRRARDGRGIGLRRGAGARQLAVDDQARAALRAGHELAAAEVHDLPRQLFIAAAVEVDAQQPRQLAVGAADEQ